MPIGLKKPLPVGPPDLAGSAVYTNEDYNPAAGDPLTGVLDWVPGMPHDPTSGVQKLLELPPVTYKPSKQGGK